ncbi:MAG: phosphatase PAP2 family protein [Lachnospiraceae bacterium]|nr:phosphatase PAP2 family protein [Lachnospiraceae bacterium]
MTEEQFRKMSESIRRQKWMAFILNALDKMITGITFLCYPLLIAFLFMQKDPFLIPSIVVPAVSFTIVTLFRKMYNAKRPYELYDFEPVIQKNTLGKSFPSRHVFSIFIIAMTFMQVQIDLGVWFLLLGAILGAIRVFGGVHFIKDVSVGAISGVVAGLIGYYIFF